MKKNTTAKPEAKPEAKKLNHVTALDNKVIELRSKVNKFMDKVALYDKRKQRVQQSLDKASCRLSNLERSLQFVTDGGFAEFRIGKSGAVKRVLDAESKTFKKVTVNASGEFEVIQHSSNKSLTAEEVQHRLDVLASEVGIEDISLYEEASRKGNKLVCKYVWPIRKRLPNGDTIPAVAHKVLFALAIPKGKQAEAYLKFAELKATAINYRQQLVESTQAQA